ncbi:hypothetical protein AWV80_16875 [Cupriavidus sp. UYMU48A]|nr:hypothetical protein AWV80_16875 [Cupriavidus sp. UYMU48A]
MLAFPRHADAVAAASSTFLSGNRTEHHNQSCGTTVVGRMPRSRQAIRSGAWLEGRLLRHQCRQLHAIAD